jgi:cell division transport system ATP-binding protein
MVDKMRRRVIELYEGRVVRDEAGGGYTEESTNEFGMRMRAEMGVAPEGQTNGHDSLI